jgi:hypothetical protein
MLYNVNKYAYNDVEKAKSLKNGDAKLIGATVTRQRQPVIETNFTLSIFLKIKGGMCMLHTKSQKRCFYRFYLLTAEINVLKKLMIEVYERNGSLRDPILIKLSEILDHRLNELRQLTKIE